MNVAEFRDAMYNLVTIEDKAWQDDEWFWERAGELFDQAVEHRIETLGKEG